VRHADGGKDLSWGALEHPPQPLIVALLPSPQARPPSVRQPEGAGMRGLNAQSGDAMRDRKLQAEPVLTSFRLKAITPVRCGFQAAPHLKLEASRRQTRST